MYICREGRRENALHALKSTERAGILETDQNSHRARPRAACAAHSPPMRRRCPAALRPHTQQKFYCGTAA